MKFAVQWGIVGKISHYRRRHWKLHWSTLLVSGEACLAHRVSSPYILSYLTSEEWTSQFSMTKEWTSGDFYFLNKIKNKILISPLLPVLSSLFNVIQMHLKPYSAQDKLFVLLCLFSCFQHHFLLLSPYVSYSLLSMPYSPFTIFAPFYLLTLLMFSSPFSHSHLSCLLLFPIRQAAFCNSRSKPTNSCVSSEYMMKETAGLGPSLADIWGKVVKPILK